MKNRLLGRQRENQECLERTGKNKAVVQGPDLFMSVGTVRRNANYEKLSNIMA